MLSGLAAGMTGISFWNHRVERFWKEANGFGLLDPLGESSERMTAVSEVGKAIQRHGSFFAQSQPPRARLALLVNEHTHHFFQACNGDVGRHLCLQYARSLRPGFGAWGLPVDFVDAQQAAAGELARYKAAILPMPLSLDAEYFRLLAAFVEQAGC